MKVQERVHDPQNSPFYTHAFFKHTSTIKTNNNPMSLTKIPHNIKYSISQKTKENSCLHTCIAMWGISSPLWLANSKTYLFLNTTSRTVYITQTNKSQSSTLSPSSSNTRIHKILCKNGLLLPPNKNTVSSLCFFIQHYCFSSELKTPF